jgi:hypothetical protein
MERPKRRSTWEKELEKMRQEEKEMERQRQKERERARDREEQRRRADPWRNLDGW